MSDADASEREQRDLWRAARAAGAPSPSSPAPDDLALAAWLDGRLGDADGDAVEAALAARPELLDAALAARAALATPAVPPAGSVARAVALVPRRRTPWKRLAIAAALVAAIGAGYWSGARASSRAAAAEAEVMEALDLDDGAAGYLEEGDA